MNPAHYVGRGQTFAKHVLLRQYVQRLAYKVLQSPAAEPEFLYVDGFSGPWQSNAEEFDDTSFSIVLKLLTDVRETLAARKRYPKIRAVFVEKDRRSYEKMQEAVKRYPRISVTPLAGEFEDRIPDIVQMLNRDTFLFTFIDPIGWKGFALRRIAPLLEHRPGEVIVNVMMNSIRRHVLFDGVQTTMDEFFGGGDWRSELEQANQDAGDMEEAILQVYLSRLKQVGAFDYVATTRIRTPEKARTYFYLAYGTRHHMGMEVFRESEQRCIEVQERVVVDAYHAKRERQAGTADLFSGSEDENFRAFERWRRESEARARADFEEWLRCGDAIRASALRARLMQHPYVNKKLVDGWANLAAVEGRLSRSPAENLKGELWTPHRR